MPELRYGYSQIIDDLGYRWEIYDTKTKNLKHPLGYTVIWTLDYLPQHNDLGEPPEELRQKYEQLNGLDGSVRADANWRSGMDDGVVNIVEIAADGPCAFDQPCRFGYRVETHAVYCHNERWLYSPRKCRRSWYTGGEVSDENCPGYLPSFKEVFKHETTKS